jgi:hypothetical protein
MLYEFETFRKVRVVDWAGEWALQFPDYGDCYFSRNVTEASTDGENFEDSVPPAK